MPKSIASTMASSAWAAECTLRLTPASTVHAMQPASQIHAVLRINIGRGKHTPGADWVWITLSAMRKVRVMAACLLSVVSVGLSAQVFTVSFPAQRSSKQLDGRVLLLVSNNPSEEPRMQISISPSSQQAHQRRRHRYTRAGTIFRDSACRHMHVNVEILQDILIQPQRCRVRTDPRMSSLHTLLHHVAELTGHAEVPLALHLVRLDEEYIAANGRPCKDNCNAGPLSAVGVLGIIAYLDAAKELVHDLMFYNELLALR